MNIDLRERNERPFAKEPHYMHAGKESVLGIWQSMYRTLHRERKNPLT
jgi:hypothetical protein